MSPTTREVDAARTERQRRAAETRAAEQARPRSARDRRQVEAHARATAPASWACKLPDCVEVDVWHPAQDKAAAERAARAHYMRNHYRPTP